MHEEQNTVGSKSPIFDRIIGENPDNVENLVAYALYKAHKRDWCAQFEKDNNRPPNSVDKLAFAGTAAIDSQIERYKKDAQDALGEYAGTLIDNERPYIEEEAISGRIEAAATRIESSGKFWKLVWQTVISSLLTTGILVILAFGVEIFGIDLIDSLRAFKRDEPQVNAHQN